MHHRECVGMFWAHAVSTGLVLRAVRSLNENRRSCVQVECKCQNEGGVAEAGRISHLAEPAGRLRRTYGRGVVLLMDMNSANFRGRSDWFAAEVGIRIGVDGLRSEENTGNAVPGRRGRAQAGREVWAFGNDWGSRVGGVGRPGGSEAAAGVVRGMK